MRVMPKARVGVVSKEEKEARLKAFIAAHIETVRARAAHPPADAPIYRLLALSSDSPAARALEELSSDLAAAGIKVEAILARQSRNGLIAFAECRFVNDLRLLDAHEQLVLDGESVWIGDCMRRDPLRRDTYEQYSDKCSATAARAGRSFAQIWRAAGPSGSLAAGRRLAPVRHTPLFDPSLIAGADAAPAPALLRH